MMVTLPLELFLVFAAFNDTQKARGGIIMK